MSGQKTFRQQIDELQRQVSLLDDNIDESVIEDTAVRLQRLNFTPPLICPVDRFLRMRNQELLAESAANNQTFKEILDSQNAYMKMARKWTEISDYAYLKDNLE